MQPLLTDADLACATEALITIVPGFAAVAEAAGPLPLRHQPPGYSGLAGIVVAQMVSRASADAIWTRLVDLTGEVTAEAVLARPVEALRAVGLSGAKAATLLRLAEACHAGLDLEATAFLPADQALARLTAIGGIGPWTAEVYLLFSAGHPDVFPAGDVALQAAAAHAFDLASRPPPAVLRRLAAEWQPQRSIAARLLWAYYGRVLRRGGTPAAPL